MNGNRQLEVHYINTGFPYTVTESFMDLFEGLTYAQADFSLAEALQDQEGSYWSFHTNSYKHGFPGSSSSSYYGYSHAYEANDHFSRTDGSRRAWENYSIMSNDEPINLIPHGDGAADSDTVDTHASPEECYFLNPRFHYQEGFGFSDHIRLGVTKVIERLAPDVPFAIEATRELAQFRGKIGRFGDLMTQTAVGIMNPGNQTHHVTNSSQVIWQDNIDPDNMTYEELLDLGEAVGTHSRGLSQERISALPVSKYKCGFFSRRKTRDERCVICQMEYKRGDRRMSLPCKHAYHVNCGTRWLSINKACPVCYIEVFGEESKQ